MSRYYIKSPTVQDAFRPIPGLISMNADWPQTMYKELTIYSTSNKSLLQRDMFPASYMCRFISDFSAAIVDVLKFAILTALLCSSILGLHSFLPHRWPGILHTGYSRLHLISSCLGSPPHMVSTCESLYSLSVSNCELGKNWQEVITNHFLLMT